jgi:hypothetical protein
MASNCELVHNSTNYSAYITSKLQKAYDTYKNSTDTDTYKWTGILKFYQYVIKLIIGNPEYCIGKNYNARGLLMYAAMGMGKTRAAVAAALSMADNRPVIIMLPKSLQSNMTNTIEQVCNMLGDKRFTAEDLLNRFSFVSLDAYNLAKQLSAAGRGKRHPGTGQLQREGLDGKLLIVDEAHNLFRSIINSGATEDASNARQVYDLIMKAKNLKLLFMTGTPAAKDPFEIVPCFNMLAGWPILPERYDAFYDAFIDGQTVKNGDKLANLLTGMVSHVCHSMPTEPGMLLEPKQPGDDGWFPVEKPIEVVEVEMSKPQYLAYLVIREREMRETQNKKSSNSVSTAPLSLPGKTSNVISTYYVKSRTVSTYYNDSELNTIVPDEIHSPKLTAAVKFIKEAPGPVLVYSQFVESGGLNALGAYLEAAGFSGYKLESDNINLAANIKNTNDIIGGGIVFDKYDSAAELDALKTLNVTDTDIINIIKAGVHTVKLADIQYAPEKEAQNGAALDVYESRGLFGMASTAIALMYFKTRSYKCCPKSVRHISHFIQETNKYPDLFICNCGGKCQDPDAKYYSRVANVDNLPRAVAALYKPPFTGEQMQALWFADAAANLIRPEQVGTRFNNYINKIRTWATASTGYDRCYDCAAHEAIWSEFENFAGVEYDANWVNEYVDNFDKFDYFYNCRCSGENICVGKMHGLMRNKTRAVRALAIKNAGKITPVETATAAKYIQIADSLFSSKYLWEAAATYRKFYVCDIASALTHRPDLIYAVLEKNKDIGRDKIGVIGYFLNNGGLNIIEGLELIARNLIDGIPTIVIKIITRRELIESYAGQTDQIKNNEVSFPVIEGAGENETISGKQQYAIISGGVSVRDRQRLQDIFNSEDNKYGEKIKVIAISKTGAEGLNLKNISMVIHLEPYWDMARHEQVLSRAVRMGSHNMLPKHERVVRNIILMAKANASILEGLSNKTEIETIDQRFYAAAKEKKVLIESIRDILKRACIECRLFGYPGCYSCRPTDEKLYGYDNDLTRPNPCSLEVEREADVLPIEGTEYFYDDDNIYEFSPKLDAYVPISSADPRYADLKELING